MSYLIFTEQAFAKLLWFRKNCHENNVLDTKYVKSDFLEVSLMGISQEETGDGLLTIEDFVCVPQECSTGATEPTDEGMALYFEDMLFDREINSNRCGRVWAHTHPGTSPTPSSTDRDTFSKWFKDAEFAVMYILADGHDYCEIKHTSKQLGPVNTTVTSYVLLTKTDPAGKSMFISTQFAFEMDKLCIKMQESFGSFVNSVVFADYSHLHEEWMAELKKCVKKKSYHTTHSVNTGSTITTSAKDVNVGGLTKKERKALQRQKDGNGFTTDVLLSILIKNKKSTLTELTNKGIQAMAQHYGVPVGKIQSTYSNIIQFEKWCTEAEVSSYIHNLIVNGKNAIKSGLIGESMLIQICTDLTARPAHISEIVDDMLIKGATNV